MERIKLAIERARLEAAGAAAVLHAPLERARGAPPPRVRAAGEPAGAVPQAATVMPLDRAHLERHRIVTLDPGNPYRREFDLLRTQVLQKMQEHGWRTLAVTSPSVKSGKTMVAVNLALSVALHPSRSALLVDCDLRRPQVAASLGLPQGASFDEVLAGEAQLGDAIVQAGIPKFQVLPTHRKVAGAAEVLASEGVGRLISMLRECDPERVIIFDLPPVTAVDDVIAILPRVDCVLLVVGSGSSSKREIEESQRHLARSNLLGVVVNKVVDKAGRGEYY
jgi:protein-tyrosine kinase